MEVIVGKNAGFCYGVEKAVETTKNELEKCNKLYCLGELVHNSGVVKQLEEKGLKTIDDINEVMEKAIEKIVIRAHGVSKHIYENAEKLGIKLVDLTCPNVLRIHNVIEQYANDDYFIFLIGSKKHPETIGSYSFAGMYSYIIETEEDIKYALESLKNSQKRKLLIVAQTTFSLNKFNEFIEIINKNINDKIEIKVKNTICNATKLRQEETKELAKNVDCMIIIGGKNSSNTKKLYEISKMNCGNTFLIEDVHELEINRNVISQFKKIGIMAGASTPKEHIEEVKEFLK